MKRLLIGLFVMALGCGAPQGSSTVGIRARALSDYCSEQGEAFSANSITKARIVVTDKKDDGTVEELLDHTSKVGSDGKLTVPGVPESMNATVTLLASAANGNEWVARRRNVRVTPEKPVDLDMVMVPHGKSVCVGRKEGLKPTMFPAVVRLTDGRVMIAGGFTTATMSQDGKKVTFSNPSNKAYIYDPFKGMITQIPSTMTEGRAAFGMANLNLESGEQVVLFGGAKKISMTISSSKDLSEFPLSWGAGDALSTYETFDVSRMKFSKPGKDAAGNAKMMILGRVFPVVTTMQDNTVLITGGGLPPKSAYGYIKAQVYSPYADEGKGNFQGACNCLSMQTQRNGQVSVPLVTTGTPQHLFVGGTTDGKTPIEVYTESSHQKEEVNGTFYKVKTKGSLPIMFFPGLSALGPQKYLLTGGVRYDTKKKTFFLGDDYYVLELVMKSSTHLLDSVTIYKGSFKGAGRFLYSSFSIPDTGLVALVGGFTDFSGTAKGKILFYDIATSKFTEDQDKSFVPKGGFGGLLLQDDTFMLSGGIKDYNSLAKGNGLLEIHSSTMVPVVLYK